MTPQQIASAAAHDVAAQILRADLIAQIEASGSAVINDFGMRVTVAITRYVSGEISTTATAPTLPALYLDVLALLDKELPRKAVWLAVKLKRQPSGSFRTMLSLLVRLGFARKVKGGYLLP